MIEPLQGKVRAIKYWTFPSVQQPKYRVIPTRWGDNTINKKISNKDKVYAYRIDEYYYWLEVYDNGIHITSWYRIDFLGKDEFSTEECNNRYADWRKCTTPTLIRYFGRMKNE